jgi:hypothetical protein
MDIPVNSKLFAGSFARRRRCWRAWLAASASVPSAPPPPPPLPAPAADAAPAAAVASAPPPAAAVAPSATAVPPVPRTTPTAADPAARPTRAMLLTRLVTREAARLRVANSSVTLRAGEGAAKGVRALDGAKQRRARRPSPCCQWWQEKSDGGRQ